MILTVVLPARNEEGLIKKCILDISKFVAKKRYKYEIIVVANGCEDNTIKIVNDLIQKNKNIKVIKSKPGYGHALKKGMAQALGDYVVVFNVDFYDLKIIDLIDIDLYGKDLIIGSKMAHWSEDKRPVRRKVVSYLYNILLKALFKFRGSDTHGIKVMKKEVVSKILRRCKTTDGIMDTEFVIRAQREQFKIADFPVTLEEKRESRFINRIFSTPVDIYNLYKVLKTDIPVKKNPQVKKEMFYDDFAEVWESKINNSETNKRLKVIFEYLLTKKQIESKKFLEVGCGLGYFSQKAHSLGAITTAVDIGPNLIKLNKIKNPKIKFNVASASSLPFKSNSFDIVLATEVIEHVEQQRKSIKEMFRVLKENGIVVITTPNKIFKPLFDFLSLVRIRPYQGNENWYYPWELKRILGKYGKIEKSVYFNFIYPNNFFERFERYDILKYLMINQGYLIKK